MNSLTKKIVQKLYTMHTKIMQNSIKFAYILYMKIVKSKTSYDNKYTRLVHEIPTCIQKLYNRPGWEWLAIAFACACTHHIKKRCLRCCTPKRMDIVLTH